MSRLVFILLLLPCVFGQDLIAKFSSAKLSVKNQVTSCYDGEDSVYILGGSGECCSQYVSDILKFSISKDTIEVVGQLPVKISAGLCSIDSEGKVYYFGGMVYESNPVQSTIYQFDPVTGNTSQVGNTFVPLMYGKAIHIPDTGNTLIFSSTDYYATRFNVSEYNINTHASTKVTDLPGQMYGSSSAIAYDGSDFVYLFGSYSNFQILKYSVKTKVTTSRSQDISCSTSFSSGPTAIFDGETFFITAGAGDCATGLLRYNPTTLKMDFHNVQSPYQNGTKWIGIATSVIYVESLNRIYSFGGFNYDQAEGNVNDIIYVDLDPVNNPTDPTTTEPEPEFSCVDKTDGSYPDPLGDCTKYFICLSETAYEASCPNPLLFNPDTEACDLPTNVVC